MRVVSLLIVLLSCSVVPAQETNQRSPQSEPNIPTTLAEAHAALERMLSSEALVGVGDQDRVTPQLPQQDEVPDLGMDGQSLLAVYSEAIYRLDDRQWTRVHSGDILLPRSGLPPQRHGDMVLLRGEGDDGQWSCLPIDDSRDTPVVVW